MVDKRSDRRFEEIIGSGKLKSSRKKHLEMRPLVFDISNYSSKQNSKSFASDFTDYPSRSLNYETMPSESDRSDDEYENGSDSRNIYNGTTTSEDESDPLAPSDVDSIDGEEDEVKRPIQMRSPERSHMMKVSNRRKTSKLTKSHEKRLKSTSSLKDIERIQCCIEAPISITSEHTTVVDRKRREIYFKFVTYIYPQELSEKDIYFLEEIFQEEDPLEIIVNETQLHEKENDKSTASAVLFVGKNMLKLERTISLHDILDGETISFNETRRYDKLCSAIIIPPGGFKKKKNIESSNLKLLINFSLMKQEDRNFIINEKNELVLSHKVEPRPNINFEPVISSRKTPKNLPWPIKCEEKVTVGSRTIEIDRNIRLESAGQSINDIFANASKYFMNEIRTYQYHQLKAMGFVRKVDEMLSITKDERPVSPVPLTYPVVEKAKEESMIVDNTQDSESKLSIDENISSFDIKKPVEFIPSNHSTPIKKKITSKNAEIAEGTRDFSISLEQSLFYQTAVESPSENYYSALAPAEISAKQSNESIHPSFVQEQIQKIFGTTEDTESFKHESVHSNERIKEDIDEYEKPHEAALQRMPKLSVPSTSRRNVSTSTAAVPVSIEGVLDGFHWRTVILLRVADHHQAFVPTKVKIRDKTVWEDNVDA